MSLLTGHKCVCRSTAAAKTNFFSRSLWQNREGGRNLSLCPRTRRDSSWQGRAQLLLGQMLLQAHPQQGMMIPSQAQQGQDSKIRDPKATCHCCHLTRAPAPKTLPVQGNTAGFGTCPPQSVEIPKNPGAAKPRLGRVREKVTLLQSNTPKPAAGSVAFLATSSTEFGAAQAWLWPATEVLQPSTSDGKALCKTTAPVQSNPNTSLTPRILSLHHRENRAHHTQPTRSPKMGTSIFCSSPESAPAAL